MFDHHRKKLFDKIKMKKIVKLGLEATAVGIILAAISLVVSYAGDLIQNKKINWWPDHVYGMLIGTIVSGAIFHIGFEALGLNARYCKQYTRLLKF